MAGVRFTVYLPGELRERGIEADLNFSEILRKGVIAELRARDAGDGDTSTSTSSSSSDNN